MKIVLEPAHRQLAMLREGKISAEELAGEHILQIQRLNPVLNALVDFDAQGIKNASKSARKGPLAGLPMTVKSSISAAGYRCEIGSLIHKSHIPKEDAAAVARLRAAGAVLLGTTNCPEFLMAYETDNLLYGKTLNPWDLKRSPGGSSGGESAAIAAGLSAGGLGSDSGGSVRQPAHFTGICALKPTPGRIPAAGHLPPCVGPFSILGALGPMARTITDVALFFGVMAGHTDTDPTGAPVALRKYSPEDLKQIPISWLEDDGLVPVTAETGKAVRDAAQVLERKGFRVVKPLRPKVLEGTLELARRLWWLFFVRCGAMFYAPVIAGKHDLLSPVFREFLSFSAGLEPLSGDELLKAWAECDLIRAKLLEQMREFPILLTPVCSVPAFRHGERRWEMDGGAVEYLDAMRFTQWFNLLAAPAAVVPVGRSPEGLPTGVQVAGRPWEDEAVLGVAAAIEAEFGYVAPPLAGE